MSNLAGARGLLVDLDDTLYDYAPADEHARRVVWAAIANDLGVDSARVESAWNGARERVKERLGNRASSHSRLLYLMELAHVLAPKHAAGHVRKWEATFWKAYLARIELRPAVLLLFRAFRARGGKIAIVTDLTLAPQLDKLAAFSLFGEVDAVVASEEVPLDKPAREIFDLALSRIGLAASECIVVGDSESKDGEGARAIGARFFLVSTRPPHTLEDLAKELS